MNKLSLIGRILYALPFAFMGINHFIMIDFYTGLLSSFIPGGGYTVIFIGIILILAALAIILKKFVQISAFVLAALLFAFITTIHIPHLFEPDIYQPEIVLFSLMKDVALLGGSLIIAGMCHFQKQNEPEMTK